MTLLLLIRHAENDVMYRRLAGRIPQVHLNAKGREQAARLAQALEKAPIQAVYSSPLERAVETAQPLAESRGLEVQIRPGLLEIDYGSWQGKTYAQLKRTKLWQTTHQTPSQVRFPNGEAFTEIQGRVIAEIESLTNGTPDAPDEEKVIAVVSHGDIVRLALAHFLTISLDNYLRLYISPASLSIIRIPQQGNPQVVVVNQTAGYQWPAPPEPKNRKGNKKI